MKKFILLILLSIFLANCSDSNPVNGTNSSTNEYVDEPFDFYPFGDGKIKIAIESYNEGNIDLDAFSYGDPYFLIKFDDGDNIYTSYSTTWNDRYSLTNPYSKTYNIDDNLESIKFSVVAYDEDLTGDEIIDYVEDDDGVYYTHTVDLHDLVDEGGYREYSYSGPGCSIRYSVSIVE